MVHAQAGMVADHRVDEFGEVLFGAGVGAVRVDGARGDAQRRRQALGTVARVFEFACQRLVRGHRQIRGDPRQGLDAGHLVDGEDDLVRGLCGGAINRAEIGDPASLSGSTFAFSQ